MQAILRKREREQERGHGQKMRQRGEVGKEKRGKGMVWNPENFLKSEVRGYTMLFANDLPS